MNVEHTQVTYLSGEELENLEAGESEFPGLYHVVFPSLEATTNSRILLRTPPLCTQSMQVISFHPLPIHLLLLEIRSRATRLNDSFDGVLSLIPIFLVQLDKVDAVMVGDVAQSLMTTLVEDE